MFRSCRITGAFCPSHGRTNFRNTSALRPIDLIADTPTGDFLDDGWPDLNIRVGDARRKFADLARRALDNLFLNQSLCCPLKSQADTTHGGPRSASR